MRKPPATAQPAPLISLGCFLSRANWSLQHRMTAGATVAVVVAGVTEVSDVHPAAAEVVQAVAEWVLASPGPADSAVLVGNGEFAVLCGGVRESSETDTIVRRIRDAATRRFPAGGVPVPVVTAAGVAMASAPGDSAEIGRAHV